jgi:hypothetical protein
MSSSKVAGSLEFPARWAKLAGRARRAEYDRNGEK